MRPNDATSSVTATPLPMTVGSSSTTTMALIPTKRLPRAAQMWMRWWRQVGWNRWGSTPGAPGWDDGAYELPSCFLGSDDEMDQAIRRGDEEAIEIFAQLLDLIAPLNTVHFQKCRGFLGVVCFEFQPNIRMTQVRDTVDPKAVWSELENAAVLFLLDQRQPERVPIKSNRLLISVAGTFDSDVPTA